MRIHFLESYKCNNSQTMLLEIVQPIICLNSVLNLSKQFPLQCFSALLRFPATTKKSIRNEINLFFDCEKLKLKNKEEKFNYILMVLFCSCIWVVCIENLEYNNVDFITIILMVFYVLCSTVQLHYMMVDIGEKKGNFIIKEIQQQKIP